MSTPAKVETKPTTAPAATDAKATTAATPTDNKAPTASTTTAAGAGATTKKDDTGSSRPWETMPFTTKDEARAVMTKIQVFDRPQFCTIDTCSECHCSVI
jgi:hypothetical protein